MRLHETYCWLFVPYIDPEADIKTVQWDIMDIGGGTDTIPVKAARKMDQGEQVITKWAPALLQMCLDDLLWRDGNDLSIKKLWEYLSTYCYQPRLSGYSVLEEAIREGLASDEYFGIAGAYSEEKGRYIDLKFNQSVLNFNQTDLLVKPDIARSQKQKEKEEQEKQVPPSNPGGTGLTDMPAGHTASSHSGGFGPSNPPEQPPKQQVQNRHFYMSVKLDNTRVNRDVANYVQEVLQHLMNVEGADVEMRLEVEVNAENGIPAAVVRTVSENCRTLKVKDFGFDS